MPLKFNNRPELKLHRTNWEVGEKKNLKTPMEAVGEGGPRGRRCLCLSDQNGRARLVPG